MARPSLSQRFKRLLAVCLSIIIALLVSWWLYRGAMKAAAGVATIAVTLLAGSIILEAYREALQYNREREKGKPHSKGSRIIMFVGATMFSCMVLCLCSAALIPLWRAFVIPLLRIIF